MSRGSEVGNAVSVPGMGNLAAILWDRTREGNNGISLPGECFCKLVLAYLSAVGLRGTLSNFRMVGLEVPICRGSLNKPQRALRRVQGFSVDGVNFVFGVPLP